MQALSVKKLSDTNLNLAKKLLRVWFTQQELPQLPSDEYLDQLLASPSFHIWIALMGDEVVGGLTGYELPLFTRPERELFLYELETSEKARRKGVATALIDAAKDFCRNSGIKIAYIPTEMENTVARKFYESTQAKFEAVAWYTYKADE
ncbi:MAG: GNAT family N-acetyltransferase [Bacteroidota bacterium]